MLVLPDNILVNLGILIVSFAVLIKASGFLVDGAVGIAFKLNIPKIVIGIVLVGFATTAPEFTVSVMAALSGNTEISLGNAVGSVIVDDAVALGLGILVAPTVITIDSKILRNSGFFLIGIDILAFILCLNGIFERWEGAVLILILFIYLFVVYRTEKKRKASGETPSFEKDTDLESAGGKSIRKLILFFIAGVAGVLIASNFLLSSAKNIAVIFHVPEIIIGLTVIAFGTSLPEIATCISAARKGHGDLAFGDIIGADILNILWIIGAASIANPIKVKINEILFMFPSMIVVVLTMLLLARMGHKLQKWKGFILLSLYVVYMGLMIVLNNMGLYRVDL